MNQNDRTTGKHSSPLCGCGWIDPAERTTAQQRVIDLCEVLRQTELADGALRSRILCGVRSLSSWITGNTEITANMAIQLPCSRPPERGTVWSPFRIGAVKSCRGQAHDTEGVGIVDVQAVEMAAEWHRKKCRFKKQGAEDRSPLRPGDLGAQVDTRVRHTICPLRIGFVVFSYTYSPRRASSASSASWSNTRTSAGLLVVFGRGRARP